MQESENPADINTLSARLPLGQEDPALCRFKTFLPHRAGTLSISYRVAAYKNSGTALRIVGDDGEFGLGAYRRTNNAWASSLEMNGVSKQLLVALREWKNSDSQRGSLLRSDQTILVRSNFY